MLAAREALGNCGIFLWWHQSITTVMMSLFSSGDYNLAAELSKDG